MAFARASNVLPSTTAAVEQYIADLEQQPEVNLQEQAKKTSAAQLKNAEVLIQAREDLFCN